MLHLWLSVTIQAKVILLAMSAFAFVSVTRFARLAFRLYGDAGEASLRERFTSGETSDPSLLAAYALKCRRLCTLPGHGRVDGKTIGDEAVESQKALLLLRMVHVRFRFLWALSYADVTSGRRTSVVVLMLSVVVVGVDPLGPFQPPLLFQKTDELIALLTVGTSLCATLYSVSSVFERVLAKRKAGWRCFRSQLFYDLSREVAAARGGTRFMNQGEQS